MDGDPRTGPGRGMSVHFLWQDPGLDRAHEEEIAGPLRGPLIPSKFKGDLCEKTGSW